MRLVKAVGRLEAQRAQRCGEGVVGVCWSSREFRVDASKLAEGEYIAADVHLLENVPADCPRWPMEGNQVMQIRERVTTDLKDLGVVYGPGGERVGIVVRMDRRLLVLSPDAAPEA